MKYIGFFLFFTFCSVINAEIEKNAIVLKKMAGHQTGDTIILYGLKLDEYDGTTKYFVKNKRNNTYKYIHEKFVKPLESNLSYWEEVYFRERAAYNITKGWNNKYKEKLSNDANDFASFCLSNELIYDNDFLTDYIYNLVQKIHPVQLYKENKFKNRVIIIDVDNPFITSFNEGTIVISTGFIADTKNEKDLVTALAQQIAHDVLEHNLINLKIQAQNEKVSSVLTALLTIGVTAAMLATNSENDLTGYEEYDNGSDFTSSVYVNYDNSEYIYSNKIASDNVIISFGAKYSYSQDCISRKYASHFVNERYPDIKQKSDEEYKSIIAETVTKKAWNAYHNMENEKAFLYVSKNVDSGVATEEDYLLKVRLYRLFYSSNEKMNEALNMITTAKAIKINPIIELDKEEALIYSRLGNQEKSIEAYKRYKEGLLILIEKGKDMSDELARINEILYK